MGTAASGELTTVTMPRGLVGGAETIIFYTAFLLWPGLLPWLFTAMAVMVAVGVVLRLGSAAAQSCQWINTDRQTMPTVLITGASGGIGHALAIEYARAGARVLGVEPDRFHQHWPAILSRTTTVQSISAAPTQPP